MHPGLRLRAPEPHHRRGSESAGCRLVPCEFSQWLMEFKRPTALTVLCVGRVCRVMGRTVLWAAVSVALAGMATGLSAKVGSCFHHNPGNGQDWSRMKKWFGEQSVWYLCIWGADQYPGTGYSSTCLIKLGGTLIPVSERVLLRMSLTSGPQLDRLLVGS